MHLHNSVPFPWIFSINMIRYRTITTVGVNFLGVFHPKFLAFAEFSHSDGLY